MRTWHVAAVDFLVPVWAVALRHRGTITQGCRTPARNAETRGAATLSKHRNDLGGLACDVSFPALYERDAAAKDYRSRGFHVYIGPGYDEPERRRYRLHVQLVPYGTDPRRVLKDIPS